MSDLWDYGGSTSEDSGGGLDVEVTDDADNRLERYMSEGQKKKYRGVLAGSSPRHAMDMVDARVGTAGGTAVEEEEEEEEEEDAFDRLWRYVMIYKPIRSLAGSRHVPYSWGAGRTRKYWRYLCMIVTRAWRSWGLRARP